MDIHAPICTNYYPIPFPTLPRRLKTKASRDLWTHNVELIDVIGNSMIETPKPSFRIASFCSGSEGVAVNSMDILPSEDAGYMHQFILTGNLYFPQIIPLLVAHDLDGQDPAGGVC